MSAIQVNDKMGGKTKVIILVSLLIITICNALWTNSDYALNNIADEFSYVCEAAYFAGYDWTSLTSLWSSYYAYGYPLLLIPFFLLFDKFIYVYYAAMIINSLFLIGSFLISITVSRKIFSQLNLEKVIIGCLSISLYTSNIINTKWMWPETEVLFLYWLVAYFLMKITEAYSLKRIICLILSLIAIYISHQRGLVIWIASCIYLCFLGVWKMKFKFLNEKKYDVICIISVLIIACVSIRLFKNIVTENIYSNNASLNINNISGIAVSITSNLNIAGLKSFIIGLAGKSFYFIYGTVFIGCYGVWFCIQKSFYLVKKLRGKKELILSNYDSMLVFFLLSFLGALLLNVIFMMSGYWRHDTLIYGRYMEYTYGPLLFVGFYDLFSNSNRWKKYLIFSITGILCSIIVSITWASEATTYYKSMFSSSIVYYFFFQDKLALEEIPYVIVIVRNTIFMLIIIGITVFEKKIGWKKQIGIMLALFSCVFIWEFNALKYNKGAYVYQNSIAALYNNQIGTLSEMEGLDNIYVIYDYEDTLDAGGDVTKIKRLQVLLYEQIITPIYIEDVTSNNACNTNSVYFISKTRNYHDNLVEYFGYDSIVIDDNEWTACWIE